MRCTREAPTAPSRSWRGRRRASVTPAITNASDAALIRRPISWPGGLLMHKEPQRTGRYHQARSVLACVALSWNSAQFKLNCMSETYLRISFSRNECKSFQLTEPSKNRNYSRFRQFSERVFGESIIRMQRPLDQCRVTNIFLNTHVRK